MQPVELVLLGAGSRGTFAYGGFVARHPHLARFVAVAEPDPGRRERFVRQHAIPPERAFGSWQELLAQPQLGEALINATMDQAHVETTLAALGAGYHVLLEKPIATDPVACARLVQAAERSGRLLQICHVLRYTPFWSTVRQMVISGALGEVMSVNHSENVAYWHMAHSFVRGNWNSTVTSSPMILAKCCHDMDILHWILGSPVARLSSFGRLQHYRPEGAPAGAPLRCTDGCPAEETCPFNAVRQYLGEQTSWPVNVISLDLSLEGRLRALQTGPYGRCVYHCDNDVVDHQAVNMELESGATVAFVMQGHSHNNVRTMRYDGTRATLRATETTDEIVVHDHLTGTVTTIHPGEVQGGHGGGDTGLMRAFLSALRDPSYPAMTTARASLESHLMAFAAERARVEHRVVEMPAYRQEIERAAAGR